MESELQPQADPTLKSVFRSPELNPESFDATALVADGRLKVVYFWGVDCPNCVIAKEQMRVIANRLSETNADFHSVNAYQYMDLATRFGLFGIPVFLLFKNGRLLGKITSFPGQDEFLKVLSRFV